MSKQILSAAVFASLIAIAIPAFEACRSQQSVSSQMSDASITTAVKSKMIADGDVRARDIDVDTHEGVVYLIGRVRTSSERMKAEQIARSCDGVRDVVNRLEVSEVA